MDKAKVDEKVKKHLATLKIPRGYEGKTENLVQNMMEHPAFNNSNYKWSLDDFELGKRLGRGKFGRVYIGKEKRTDFIVAIKTIMKAEVAKGHVELQVAREIEIQSRLKHPNILQLLDWFHDSHRIYLILEFAGKGELYPILQNSPNHRFNEKDSAKYIYQVSDAINYCHQMCVIHRDIKPENLLLTITGDIKVADFGWSVHSPSLNRNTMCGTLDYLPPEMVCQKNYKHTVDNWCIGVLCYEFLHGNPPFAGSGQKETYKRINSRDLHFADYVSKDARDLIDKLLCLSASQRLTLPEVMRHPWVVNNK